MGFNSWFKGLRTYFLPQKNNVAVLLLRDAILIIPIIIQNRYIDRIILRGRLEDEKIKEDEVNVHVVGMEREIYTYKIAVVKPEGNRAIGRPKHAWENNFLKRTLKIYARRKWTGAVCFRIGTTLKDVSLFSKASRRAVGLIKTFIA